MKNRQKTYIQGKGKRKKIYTPLGRSSFIKIVDAMTDGKVEESRSSIDYHVIILLYITHLNL